VYSKKGGYSQPYRGVSLDGPVRIEGVNAGPLRQYVCTAEGITKKSTPKTQGGEKLLGFCNEERRIWNASR